MQSACGVTERSFRGPGVIVHSSDAFYMASRDTELHSVSNSNTLLHFIGASRASNGRADIWSKFLQKL